MPYGIDKKQGGDSPSNDKFMEDCVSKISGSNKRTGKPYTKGEKIAICKTALKRRKAKAETQQEEYVYDYEEAENIVNSALEHIKEHLRNLGRTDVEAEAMLEPILWRANFSVERLDKFL